MTRATEGGPIAAGDVVAAVARVRQVPGRYRRFEQSADDARRTHGISSEVLEALLDAGLPSEVSDGGHALDELDLANVSLQLNLPSSRAMALRGWVGALRTASESPEAEYEVTFQARCPNPGHHGGCVIDQPPELAAALGRTSLNIAGRGFSVQRRTSGASIRLPDRWHAVIAEVAGFTYHLLPNELHMDLGFLRSTGLADCPLVAEYVYQEVAQRGEPVRRSFGIFLGVPYSIPHFWVDVRLDDEWHAIDPLLIAMLSGRGLIDPAVWPPHRTLGSTAWRLSDRDLPLAQHNGVEIPCSIPTRRR